MPTIDVTLNSGAGTATLTDTDLIIARGIPYGVASRFQAATPPPPWTGRRMFTERGPVCPQLPSRLSPFVGDVTAGLHRDEQCLVLTVTAPAYPAKAGRPVMVWFHGGAYVAGTGEAAVYDADALAAEGDVVVVSVSYRLGIFGYLTLDGAGASNLGLRDQLLALTWIRDNVAAFGGDPANVTAFGQSAGADSLRALLLTPEADGLYHRAILQSAPFGMHQDRAPMAAAMHQAAMKALSDKGIKPLTATVEELLEVQLIAADTAKGLRFRDADMPYGPLDGQAPMVRGEAHDDRLAAIAPRIDLLIGDTTDDAAPFVALAYAASKKQEQKEQRGPATFDNPKFREDVETSTRSAFTDPRAALVTDWRDYGGQVNTFQIKWAPPDAPMKACHCIELPLLFGSPDTWAGVPMLGTGPIDHKLARRMRRWWTQFARHGSTALPAHLSIDSESDAR